MTDVLVDGVESRQESTPENPDNPVNPVRKLSACLCGKLFFFHGAAGMGSPRSLLRGVSPHRTQCQSGLPGQSQSSAARCRTSEKTCPSCQSCWKTPSVGNFCRVSWRGGDGVPAKLCFAGLRRTSESVSPREISFVFLAFFAPSIPFSMPAKRGSMFFNVPSFANLADLARDFFPRTRGWKAHPPKKSRPSRKSCRKNPRTFPPSRQQTQPGRFDAGGGMVYSFAAFAFGRGGRAFPDVPGTAAPPSTP